MKIKNKFLDFLILNIGVYLGYLIIYILCSTLRVKIIDKAGVFINKKKIKHKKVVCVIWHNQLLVLAGYFRWTGLGVMISQSKDGELIARIAKLLKFKVFRGSSTRGGAGGLLSMLKNKNADNGFVFTVDGPRGPVYKVKDGCIFFSKKSSLPIIPVWCKISNSYEINSWDKLKIPFPFSKVTVIIEEPIKIEEPLTKKNLEKYKKLIQTKLNA
jgi:lysophospholipid acyltransferase (LPLAT)-like uncharacterized protein